MWKARCHENLPPANFEFFLTIYFIFQLIFVLLCSKCLSFYEVSGGPFGFTEFRSLNSVSHPQELKIGWGGCLCERVLSWICNFYHKLVFDYEFVRFVDGLFEPSSLVLSARFGYICCVGKAFHVAKLRHRLFPPQSLQLHLVLLTWFHIP